jgi:hypothetical protein
MNPITGPTYVYSTNSIDGAGSLFKKQTRYRQAKPFNLPLPYSSYIGKTLEASLIGSNTSYGGNAVASASKGSDMYLWEYSYEKYLDKMAEAENICAAKLKKQYLVASAELGINIAQRQQAIDSLTKWGGQLAKFLLYLKNGRFRKAKEAAQQFGWIKPGAPRRKPRKPRRPRSETLAERNRQAANLLLEVQFGLVPLAESCYNAMKILSDPMSENKCQAGHKILIQDEYQKHTPFWVHSTSVTDGSAACYFTGYIGISDPDQFLLNRMGIINPAIVLWDALPGSFLIDWFINVNQFVNATTDYFGCYFRDESTANVYRLKRLSRYYLDPYGPYGQNVLESSVQVTRRLGRPVVKLIFKTFKLDWFVCRTVWALAVGHWQKPLSFKP